MAPRRIDPRALPADSALAKLLSARTRDARTVQFTHDGETVTSYEGEPLALALLASGRAALARSAKYHRPRGPSCLRGCCDGCLVRVDGVPDVMACRAEVKDNARVESQNAFPTAGLDLLRVTDWFFPKHMDHHHLMTGLGGAANRTMISLARKMSGLGTLPEKVGPTPPPTRLTADVLVVGAGTSGAAAASTLASLGLSVVCAEEEPSPGGQALDLLAGHTAKVLDSRVVFLSRSAAVATFEAATLVLGDGALTEVRPRARLFATGCQEVLGTFAQNDAPGVYTARAFARALSRGVLLGDRVLVVGRAEPAEALVTLAREAGARVEWRPEGAVREAEGAAGVRAATVDTGGKTERVRCDALVLAEAPLPAYELAGQAGATLGWEAARRGFAPESDDEGATSASGVYVCGSVRRPFETLGARREDGVKVARRIARDLGAKGAEG